MYFLIHCLNLHFIAQKWVKQRKNGLKYLQWSTMNFHDFNEVFRDLSHCQLWLNLLVCLHVQIQQTWYVQMCWGKLHLLVCEYLIYRENFAKYFNWNTIMYNDYRWFLVKDRTFSTNIASVRQFTVANLTKHIFPDPLFKSTFNRTNMH